MPMVSFSPGRFRRWQGIVERGGPSAGGPAGGDPRARPRRRSPWRIRGPRVRPSPRRVRLRGAPGGVFAILACTFSNVKYPDRAHDAGFALLRVFVGRRDAGRSARARTPRPPDARARGRRLAPSGSRATGFSPGCRGTPAPCPSTRSGTWTGSRPSRPVLRPSWPGAGGRRLPGGGIADCVRSGEAAAERLNSSLKGREPMSKIGRSGILALAFGLSLSGVPGPSGAAAVASRTFDAPLDRVWTATESVLKSLGWDIDTSTGPWLDPDRLPGSRFQGICRLRQGVAPQAPALAQGRRGGPDDRVGRAGALHRGAHPLDGRAEAGGRDGPDRGNGDPGRDPGRPCTPTGAPLRLDPLAFAPRHAENSGPPFPPGRAVALRAAHIRTTEGGQGGPSNARVWRLVSADPFEPRMLSPGGHR